MPSSYQPTTDELFAQASTAMSYASMSAGRINISTKPGLKETPFNYAVPNISVGPPPQFSDIFGGANNADPNIIAVNDKVDKWLAKYFPAINNGFTEIPDEWLMNVISGVKPFGIDSTIFDLVWHRARDRAYRTVTSEQRTLEASFSNRGFGMPPGALVDQLSESERRAADAALDVNREQAIQDAQIKNDLLKMAVQVAAQLKMGILNTSAEFFKAYYQFYNLDAESARLRAQAYSAFYNALASYYDVEVSVEGLKLRAAMASSETDGSIDQRRVAAFAADGTGMAHAQAARGFADVAASSANAAGTLVAQIEAIPVS